MNLLFGSDPVNACGFKLNAPATTSATLTRRSESEWLMDLPPGSIGELGVFERFEVDYEHGTGGATGRRIGGGLYQFTARIRIKSVTAQAGRH